MDHGSWSTKGWRAVRLIGLTGGIASGKSTVHRMLEALGASVLDADAIYHDLIRPRDGVASELAVAVGARFPGVLGPGGELDRAALGARVFASPAERRALDGITHPVVGRETARRLEELAGRGVPVAIYDVPLLFEAGLEGGMSGVIVVWAPREIQLRRLMARDHLDHAAAEARLAAQLPLDEKRRRATWVVDSSGSLEHTLAQVRELWGRLERGEA